MTTPEQVKWEEFEKEMERLNPRVEEDPAPCCNLEYPETCEACT